MSKKLVIFCDGTGNEIAENQSNVLKLYHMMKHDDQQLCFYDTGVGTIGSSGDWNELLIKAKTIFGLATGFGLNKNVLEAYRFLIRNYNKGDKIFIFGFSRGAYTARVLAGFIHLIGLLDKHQEHLASYAFRAYKESGLKNNNEIAYRVNKILRTQRPTISMLGCWDTVGSVFIPNPKYCYLPTLQKLPLISENPSVKRFRHAMAIDERRRLFHVVPWKQEQRFNEVVYKDDGPYVAQDIKQVWFAGVHSDIGGGYAESESQLSKLPLIWMMKEAKACGLVFRPKMTDMMAYGKDPYKGHEKRAYVGPDSLADIHDSMSTLLWRLAEYLPARVAGLWGKNRRKILGWYLPCAEPRPLGNNPNLHSSVTERLQSDIGYRPANVLQVEGKPKE